MCEKIYIYIYIYIYMWNIYIYIYIYFAVALRLNAGHCLLILEVSRSHKTTHKSRWDPLDE